MAVDPSTARTGPMPLMAGNWKMNLNHLEAIALVQKLAFALDEADFERGRGRGAAAVHRPPVACRPWSTATSSDRATARRTCRRTTPAPTPARSPGRCWPSSAAPTSRSGTASAGSTTHEDERSSTPRWPAAFRNGLVADPLRRRGPGDPAGRHARPHTAWPSSTAPSRASPPTRPARSSWRTSRCGPSAPARSRPPRTPRRSARRSAPGSRSSTPATSPTGSGSCTAGRSRRPTSAAIMAQPDVDGALVGGASLDAEEFVADRRFRAQPTD